LPNESMYGSFMSTPSTKGVDNKRLQSFPGFFSSNSSQNQTAFGSATLPTYPQQELPNDKSNPSASPLGAESDGLSYLVRLLRQNPAKLGL
jgi:hypothetical protein